MRLFKKIKNGFAVRKLKSIYNKSKVKTVFCNLEQAQSVGVIYDATNENDSRFVKDFVNKLKGIVPQVNSMGYYSKKINNDQIQLDSEFPLFYNKDLNWYGRPKSPEVEKFINNKFDILIDFKLTDCIPLKFLLVESQSCFKVGRRSEIFPDYYDLMLSVDEGTKLDYFSDQLILYLTMINKKQ